METRGEPRIADALTKGLWTSLDQRPAIIAVVITVAASPASSIVVVVRAVVAVVVDALGPSTGLDGVPRIPVGPKPTLDR
jgi:hypothetical protein